VDEALGGGPEPPAVREFKEAIERADGLLIVTPEYNWSLPGFINLIPSLELGFAGEHIDEEGNLERRPRSGCSG
jgi:hypothetical protein